MTIYLGADHKGFDLKELIKRYLVNSGYDVIDLGNTQKDPSDDYPAFARAVATEVNKNVTEYRGILVCGSGAGMCVTANKFPGIRASIVFSADHAGEIKEEDDVNVLCLAADFFDGDAAKKMIAAWLQTPASGEERHRNRIEQIRQIEVDEGLWK